MILGVLSPKRLTQLAHELGIGEDAAIVDGGSAPSPDDPNAVEQWIAKIAASERIDRDCLLEYCRRSELKHLEALLDLPRGQRGALIDRVRLGLIEHEENPASESEPEEHDELAVKERVLVTHFADQEVRFRRLCRQRGLFAALLVGGASALLGHTFLLTALRSVVAFVIADRVAWRQIGRFGAPILFAGSLLLIDTLRSVISPGEWFFFMCLGIFLSFDSADLRERAGMEFPKLKDALRPSAPPEEVRLPIVDADKSESAPTLPAEVRREMAERLAAKEAELAILERRRVTRDLRWSIAGALWTILFATLVTDSVLLRFVMGTSAGAVTCWIQQRGVGRVGSIVTYSVPFIVLSGLGVWFSLIPFDPTIVPRMLIALAAIAFIGGAIGLAQETRAFDE